MTNLFSQGKIIRQFWGKIIRQSTVILLIVDLVKTNDIFLS